MFTEVCIRHRAGFWSPFCKWRMTLANNHSFELERGSMGP